MDPFTQRMLERAEQRSRALGIGSTGKCPLTERTEGADVDSAVEANSIVPLGVQKTQYSQQQQLTTHHSAGHTPTVGFAHASTNTGSSTSGCNKLQVVEKAIVGTMSKSSNINKVHRQFSAVDKENMDLGIEINIVTDKNVEVQVEVEEKELGDEIGNGPKTTSEKSLAKIRDTSRNRLQRLGALYANPNDISSPIHRTEGQFHADSSAEEAIGNSPKRIKQRYGKLAELASSINQWEDDVPHHSAHSITNASSTKQNMPSKKMSEIPPPKPALPSRNSAGKSAKAKESSATALNTINEEIDKTSKVEDTTESISTSVITTKQLKWDPKVINSLEAQGFQRRDSSTIKLAYDYAKEENKKSSDEQKEQDIEVDDNKPKVLKLASTFSKVTEDKSQERIVTNVNSGFVSGRTAAFENKAIASQQIQRPQKDPTELSLKERMQLFERNKGEALIPKAALGMAPPLSKIRHDQAAQRREEGAKAAHAALVSSSHANTTLLSSKPSGETKLREKVAAFISSSSTMSENKIKADIQKQRQEDMRILANRFNKPKHIFGNTDEQNIQLDIVSAQPKTLNSNLTAISASSSHPPTPPPPPPPMPQAACISKIKRHSPSDTIDDDESKRARKSATIISRPASAATRLYPALSDLDSNESESDRDNGGTTATLSGRSTADETTRMLTTRSGIDNRDNNNDDESYMDSEEAEDSSIDICNGSLGREIMQVVQENDNVKQKNYNSKQIKEVRYADKNDYYGADSSINSSDASMGIDDYLDEALDDDEDDDGTHESAEDTDDVQNASQASRESKATTASNSFSFRKTPKKYTSYQTINEENDESPIRSTTSVYTPQPVKSELSINRGNEDKMVTLVHTVSFYRRQQNDNSANSTPVRTISREQQVLRSDISKVTYEALHSDSPKPHEFSDQKSKHDETNSPKPHEFSDQKSKHDETFVVEEVGEDDSNPGDETNLDEENLVQEKVRKLLDEVRKQQTIIAQTSQALNLCAATVEFSGSTESVEGERHLLVATHRRQACLDEVQRLRVEKCLRPNGSLRDKGRLTIKEVTVPLRQDYIRKLAADTISGHHLVCLLKYNEHILATKTVPTLPGLLAVKFPDVLQMNNVYADFRITLEIYGMTAQREILPHEVKYHINLNKKCGIRTPKKKSGENRLVMPPVQSPAGPNAVRSPALVQYGFAIFSLREIQRTSWTLTQVLGVSPLEGVVHMKANCELSVLVEHRGFLTMFEDISGFGAWHRRWCYLNGSVLNYWKYPDDERKKAPIGSIDLYTCLTQKISVAPRDICARLNTLLLEFERPAKETDKESLIVIPNGRTTIIRYLLSADTKEERELWCAYFNKVLLLLRAWGPPPQ
ncbi:anillin [Eurosta solidaginis]|uniref:anillin n=1 Tax=Eurosta solidaginis TaxID=178769 RepID=UPI00353074EF